MTSEEREEMYGRISDAAAGALSEFPGVALASPEGFQLLFTGLSQNLRKKGQAGIMLRNEKEGLLLDVSVAVPFGMPLAETGRKIQSAVFEKVTEAAGETIAAVNIDIIKVI